MANYVRFQRGTQEAYDKLKQAGRLNDYILYFIYDPDDDSVGTLYMGCRLISGGDATVIASALKDLTDVVINESGENYFLVQNAKGKWVSTSLNSVVALIKSQLGEPDLSNLVTKEELELLLTQISTLEDSIDNKVDKVIYQVPIIDENGDPVLDDNNNPTYKEVEGTLVTPEDREKLNALVLDEDGSGVEISGTVNAENVEGLGTWITTHGNIYIQNLNEDHLSNTVLDKLNYITSVTDNLIVIDGKLDLSKSVSDTLSSVNSGEFNFIKTVNTDIFKVSDAGNLDLIFIPINTLTPVLGDFTKLPNYTNGFKLSDENSNIYDILTWSEIENF